MKESEPHTCQKITCGKKTKELYDVTTYEGSGWYCKECAELYDCRVKRKPAQETTTKPKPGDTKYGGRVQ